VDLLTDNALRWLPHHQLLTSLSFQLNLMLGGTIEEWVAQCDLFAIVIRSLPQLQELHVVLCGARTHVPPITMASLSLRKLELELIIEQCSIRFDVPSLTELDLACWSPSFRERMDMDMFINCKKVTHLSLCDQIDASVVIPWHVFSSNMISLKLPESAQLSIHQYIQTLESKQFATLEIFQCDRQNMEPFILGCHITSMEMFERT
jgi:hypothetical protein